MLFPDFNELVALKAKTSRLAFSSDRSVTSISSGDFHSPFRGQGLEFEEVREYAHGDDIRNIDWRVTARTNMPHTKVFKEERERSVLLCVDMNSSMRFGTRSTFKSVQAARIAALLGWQANSNNDRLGGCLFGDAAEGMQFIACQRSRSSLWAMLKKLSDTSINEQAEYIPLDDVLLHVNKAAPTGALIYIVSDFSHIGENLEQQLNRLRQRCDVVLITVDDVADQYIPPIGTVLFSGKEAKTYVNTDSQSGRKAYAEQWLQTRNKLQKIATKLGIGVISISTDGDAYKDLFFGLKRIALRRRS
ncbi:MAG: hypothetical protein methR_P1210 [Methyloprofundus sp.]|nr:MAG: hypothetical protein methR_P1210 [Methyloprofundus sp.]